jgi:hypothetical protein
MLAACQRPATARGGVELADIFRAYGEAYRRHHPLPVSHLKVIEAVERCRTAALGATSSGVTPVALSAPPITPVETAPPQADQSLAQARWLEKQKSELLPVRYFHLVFTVPHELNRLILVNKKPLINILFQAVSETLLEFAQTHLKAILDITAVLHTLGLDPVRSFSSPLSGPRRSSVVRSKNAGVLPAKTFCSLLKPSALSFAPSSSTCSKALSLKTSSSLSVKPLPWQTLRLSSSSSTRYAKNHGSSTPRNLSDLPNMSSIISAATPTA